jgi:galactokinase
MSLAQLCLKAEREYVGLNCGLMDQFACLFGQADHVLHFDTTTLAWEALPIPDGLSLVVVDSGIRHNLTHSGYNDRRRECEEGLSLLQKDIEPAPASLAQITPEQFQVSCGSLPESFRKRAQHVVEECARVGEAAELLKAGELGSFGKVMVAGHASLRDLYEVSLPELDYLVEIAIQFPGCLGARLTGGGFGGCTINLVKTEQVQEFTSAIQEGYQLRFGLQADVLPCRAAEGAQVIHLC